MRTAARPRDYDVCGPSRHLRRANSECQHILEKAGPAARDTHRAAGTRLHDGDEPQRRRDPRRGPRGRGDHVAAGENGGKAAYRAAEACIHPFERCATRVPRVRVGHAARRPRWIRIVDQDDRRTAAVERAGDRGSDVVASEDDDGGPVMD